MKPITFNPTCYQIGNQPVYLNSGEFHYFRVSRTDWRRRMELLKEAGGNCVATYIPWLIHEPEEGAFRFDRGDGITDLEAFLELAHSLDLYVIARPGPYQYSELIYGGLPGWLFAQYPEVQAQTIDGHPFGLPSVSYLHPVFLEKATAWFAAVCPILARHTVSQGGPIAFTQFDNELMGIHIWFGGLDYNPTTMGFGDPEGRYPQFLRRRYKTLEALNQAYATSYLSYAAVQPLSPDRAQDSPRDVLRLRDYFDFYVETTTEYAKFLCRLMREHRIDTPLMHNAANPGMNAYFKELKAALGEELLLGSDHYYNLSQSWPQNNPTPQYARNVFLSMESLRLMGQPPTILELPSGSASDWPPITAQDAAACYMTNLAYGMKGHNYYVFTGGPNPPGVGETTDMYDYGAPISARGRIRPLYHAQAAFAAFIADHKSLTESRRVCDCRIGLDADYARADQVWQGRAGLLYSPADAWRFLSTGLLTSAFCASLSPNGVDLDSDRWVTDTTTPLLVAASEMMARDRQERLVRFVQGGGRLLIAPVLPAVDEDFRPCTVLADFLGGPEIIADTNPVTRVMVQGPKGTISNVLKNEVFVTQKLPSESDEEAEASIRIVATDELTGNVLGWQLTTPAHGQALFLGMSWDHRKDEQAAALTAALRWLGLQQVVMCSNPNVWTSLRVSGDAAILFLMNLFSTPMKAEISYCGAHGAHIDLGQQRVPAMSVKALEVSR
ncbi:MAG: beta-galactosidase [Anaerolineae bacterium]|nr:beta-galactosidase [Anaerolineae bacterium]